MIRGNPQLPAVTLYDLHSHTTASDGYLTSKQLVRRAVEMNVSVLAITDHDTTDGLAAAAEFIGMLRLPLQLVNGVEISTLWQNNEIHIIGLGIDAKATPIVQLLIEQNARRMLRAEKISQCLVQVGIKDAYNGVRLLAAGGSITRGHFARYLMQIGVAKNIKHAFKKYLVKGNFSYIKPEWCSIKQAIDVIHKSGGQAVLAHPASYNLISSQLNSLFAYFAEHGGDVIEVAQCHQSSDERSQLAKYALEYQLLASQGSDFHRPCTQIELGYKLQLPYNIKPIWHNWTKDIM